MPYSMMLDAGHGGRDPGAVYEGRKEADDTLRLTPVSYTHLNTALRSGIAMLYAHWEGMIKNIATAYLSFVANQRLQYKELKNNFWSIAIKNDLLGFDETRKSSRHNKIIKNIRNMEDKRANIPYEDVIKTKSNLNSGVFMEIMETIGLDYSQYEGNFKLLDEVLLKMRNQIAHGEKPEYIDLDQDLSLIHI